MLVDKQELLARVRNGYGIVRDMVIGLPEADLEIKGLMPEWSIKDLIAH